MACTISVASHLFKFPDAVVLQAVGEGGTYTGMVLVTANPIQLQVLAIEEKTFILVEYKGPDPEGCAYAVDQPAPDLTSETRV